MEPTLDIIIVNWNSGPYLFNCINSIPRSISESFYLNRVIVVDNNSTDGSLSKIRQIDLPLFVIRNKKNLGFAKACNQGAKESNSDYLLFLNPDTQLYKTSISSPLEFMQDPVNNKIGIIGVKIIDDNGVISRNCARFPTTYSMAYL